jgi:hypothetical protein
MAEENVDGAQEKIRADRNSGKETIQRRNTEKERNTKKAGATQERSWRNVIGCMDYGRYRRR